MNFDVWIILLSFLEFLLGIVMDGYVLHYLVNVV